MAKSAVVPTTYLLFIDRDRTNAYDVIICLTSFSLKRSTAVTDTSSFCGTSSSPGAQTTGVDFAAELFINPDTNEIAEADLHDLWVAKSTVNWKIGKAIPADGDITYKGTGFVASLDANFDVNNSTFTGSLGLGSTPTIVRETGS